MGRAPPPCLRSDKPQVVRVRVPPGGSALWWRPEIGGTMEGQTFAPAAARIVAGSVEVHGALSHVRYQPALDPLVEIARHSSHRCSGFTLGQVADETGPERALRPPAGQLVFLVGRAALEPQWADGALRSLSGRA